MARQQAFKSRTGTYTRVVAISPGFPTTIARAKLYLDHPAPQPALREWFAWTANTDIDTVTTRIHPPKMAINSTHTDQEIIEAYIDRINMYIFRFRANNVILGQPRSPAATGIYKGLRGDHSTDVYFSTVSQLNKALSDIQFNERLVAHKRDTDAVWGVMLAALLSATWPGAYQDHTSHADILFEERFIPKTVNMTKAIANYNDYYTPQAVLRIQQEQAANAERIAARKKEVDKELWADFPGGNPFTATD